MSIFPTTILLATDGSQDAELARTTAVDMATTTDSELHVVTVAPRYPSVDVNIPQVVEQLRTQAEKEGRWFSECEGPTRQVSPRS